MSALTKKKHVYQESENNYELPKDNQKIVKVKINIKVFSKSIYLSN